MRNKEVLKLVAGFRRFREKYFIGDQKNNIYHREVALGQNPKTLIVGCSDSRVDPALITSASPGEIFVVRNVANLIPPYEASTVGFHGVSAAIEFAVLNLKVENVIICGHRQCGGIRALMSGEQIVEDSFVGRWMEIALAAKKRVLEKHQDLDFEAQCKACEMEGIVSSIENLKSFPFVRDAIQKRNLKIFGIYFDLEQGQLFEFDESLGKFKQLSVDRAT